MRPSVLSLSPMLVVLFGCAGLFGEPTDSAEPLVDEDDEGDGVSIEQAEDCADYLDCLEAVDEDEYDDVKGEYGPDGSCWDNEADAEDCEDACFDALKDLEDEYPFEEACGGGGDPSDFEGPWWFTSDTVGDCQGEELMLPEAYLEFSFDGSSFSADGAIVLTLLTTYEFELSLDCEVDGGAFACAEFEGEYGTLWTFEGVFGDPLETTMRAVILDAEGAPACEITAELEGTPG